MEVDDEPKEMNADPQKEDVDDLENVEIHDLNQLVRRKRDGQHPDPPKTATTAATTAGAPSPSRLKRENAASHRLICTLSAHTGSSVLAVRFSTTGKYLASAGDDAVVCVYAPSSSSVGGNLSDNVEHWQRVKLCRGHTLDAVGLAWAPDDSHLVSCSLDSDAPIIVWKLTDLESHERRTQSNVLCNPYKILGKDVHSSTVKGVTFDPAGTYLASSGDDPAVCIWRAHDDWGLEKRIDSDSGIFRKWKEDDVQELSGQTLFRRLSWSTDGSYICSTNSSVKNKHVASTISREGWSVSSATSTASGAAHLVGHKQPVVVSRHCPYLLDARKVEENGNRDENDDEPEYATLIALGDKRGFLSVWSTRKSRPLFKIQCSESRCTVTDLTWGLVGDNNMVLLVSLLDGNVVALRFGIPNEIGPLLSDSDQKTVFRLRYGIDLDDDNGYRGRNLFVGDNSTPRLLENPLQFTLEDHNDGDEDEGEDDDSNGGLPDDDDDFPLSSLISPSKIKASQQESRSRGKKRIRPVLMSAKDDGKRPKQNGDASKKERKKVDPVEGPLELAAKAASAAGGVTIPGVKGGPDVSRVESTKETTRDGPHPAAIPHHGKHLSIPSSAKNLSVAKLPHSTDKVHSVDLPVFSSTDISEQDAKPKLIVDCTNSNRLPIGSSGQTLPCINVSISDSGNKTWKDEIVGASCSALAATESIFAVGTADGCLYLYGSSPSLGWASASAFRSHPPLVVGHAIVALHMKESNKDDASERNVEIVVVAADGMFGVYSLFPELKLLFKGCILPAMTHMVLSSSHDSSLPKLARIQKTDSGHLVILLSLEDGRQRATSSAHYSSTNPGGSLQAFVYHVDTQLWLRVSDSRFVVSDFYSTLPSNKTAVRGSLSFLQDAICSSVTAPTRRGGNGMLEQDRIVTRSHCEDRMACAVALRSSREFQHWLSLYAKTLSSSGDEKQLRLLVELLLHGSGTTSSQSSCWQRRCSI
jgi:protein HIRA/HIR1